MWMNCTYINSYYNLRNSLHLIQKRNYNYKNKKGEEFQYVREFFKLTYSAKCLTSTPIILRLIITSPSTGHTPF